MNVHEEIDRAVEDALAQRRIPGAALALVHGTEVVKLAGYGRASIEADAPVTPDTVFFIASVSKPLTAVAIMKLVELGLVKLTDRLVDLLPGLPQLWQPITIRHLLTHTAGFPKEPDWSSDRRDFYAKGDLLELFGGVELNPGAQYSDIGYCLLGMVVEEVSGESFAGFMSRQFFSPLEMHNTFYMNESRLPEKQSVVHWLREGELTVFTPKGNMALHPDAGVRTSVEDLAKWEAALAAGRLIAPELLAQMAVPNLDASGQPIKVLDQDYGMGWFLGDFNGKKTMEHGGVSGTFYMRVPELGMSAIVLTNLCFMRVSEPDVIARRALNLLMEERNI